MPLVNCPDCRNAVSNVAPACPYCGRPNPGGPPLPPRAPETGGRSVAWIIGGLLMFGLLVVGIGGWSVYRFLQRLNPPRDHPAPEVVDYDSILRPPVDSAELARQREVPDYVDTVMRETLPPDADTYELSAVEVQPELINRDEIVRMLSHNYPPLLRDAGVTGVVGIRMRVRSDGTVDGENVTVEDASHPMFNEAALRVVKQMRFRPARVGGKPVPVWVMLPVTFQLES